MHSPKIIPIIFTGFNQRACIAFIRTLCKNNIPFAIIPKSLDDTIFLTDYATNIFAVRETEKLEIDDILNTINMVKRHFGADKYLIAPSSEALNRFLSANRNIFIKNDCIIPLAEKSLYERISDKYSFAQLARKFNINIPREIRPIEKHNFPIVAKPKRYFSSKTGQALYPVIINNKQEIEYFLHNYPITDFYFQEFVTGNSYYLLYYFYRNGDVIKYSQKNLIQQPDGKSIIAAVSASLHLTNEAEKYVTLFKHIGFYGLVMVEVRQRGAICYMIEANPRFWGPSQLFVDAGINMYEDLLYDYGILTTRPEKKVKRARYFWFGGIIEVIQKNKKLVFHNYNDADFTRDFSLWLNADVYRRKDTINIFSEEIGILDDKIKRFRALFFGGGKHANYQRLYEKLTPLLRINTHVVYKPKFENERLQFIVENIAVRNKIIVDIGANTGFFAFSLLEYGAKQVICYEGNKNYAEFIKSAAEYLKVSDKVKVIPEHFNFDFKNWPLKVDVILLMNVLHHIGSDFSNEVKSVAGAKKFIKKTLSSLANVTHYLVLQIGFCWKGDRNLLLFPSGTKREMINFVNGITKKYWNIIAIGIPERINGKVIYNLPNSHNLKRNDTLGEFLNRPLFILRSKHFSTD